MREKWIKIGTLTLAALFLAAVSLLTVRNMIQYPDGYTVYENRSLSNVQPASVETVLDGSFLQSVEPAFSDHLALREYWLKAYTVLQKDLLQKPVVQGVVVQEDLLLPQYAAAEPEEAEEAAAAMAANLLTLQNTAAAEQSGCAKWTTPVMMSALTTWLAFSVPGAVGLYWIIQNLVGMVERALLNKFYNGDIMEAADEAGRYARRELEEQKVMERFANVDIRAAAQRLKERTDAEAAEKMSEKNAKTASIYDSIDAKNVIVVNNNNNDRVIKTGNVARAGGSKSKKKKK